MMPLIDNEVVVAMTGNQYGVPLYAITNIGRTFYFEQYTGWRLMKF